MNQYFSIAVSWMNENAQILLGIFLTCAVVGFTAIMSTASLNREQKQKGFKASGFHGGEKKLDKALGNKRYDLEGEDFLIDNQEHHAADNWK